MKKTLISSIILSSIISLPAIAGAKSSFDFNSYMPVKKGELQEILAPINDAIQANTAAIDNLSVTVEANSITVTDNSSKIEQNADAIANIKPSPALDIINATDYFAQDKTKMTYRFTGNSSSSPYGDMVLTRVEDQDSIGPVVSWKYYLPLVDSLGNQTAYLEGDTLFRVVENSLNVVSGSSSYNGGAVTTKTYSPEIVRMKNGSIVGIYTGGTTVETTGNTSKSLTYTVLPILKGSVTVPAGTFDNCILAKYENDPQTRTVWSCPGKGRVKWENEAGTWELTSFE